MLWIIIGLVLALYVAACFALVVAFENPPRKLGFLRQTVKLPAHRRR